MNTIIIKINDKVIGVSKICDIPQKEFIELTKKVAKTWNEQEEYATKFHRRVQNLELQCIELEEKINYLAKQIAIDRGEIDADSEEPYIIQVIRPEDVEQEIPESESAKVSELIEDLPTVSEEEDAYFEEREESEVSE